MDRLVTLSALFLTSVTLFLLYEALSPGNLTVDGLLNLVGGIVGSISFLVGTYFAVLAVNAYSHIRDIETAKANALQCVTDLKNHTTSTLASLKDMANLMDDFIGTEIYVSDWHVHNHAEDTGFKHSMNKQRSKLIRERALLAVKYAYLAPDRRLNLIRELFAVGRKEDIDLLTTLTNDTNEEEEIREVANAIIVKLNGGDI